MAGDDRVVLVTGAAKRLGAAIARTLAAAGWRVVVHHHTSGAEADALVAELGPDRAAPITADLLTAAAEDVLMEARAAFDAPIAALVNSASVFEFDRPPAFDSALLQRLMAVNLAAPVAFACALADQPDLDAGAVVNVLDQKVANLNADFFSYTCTKVALAGATEMLARSLAPRVRVNAVSPGLTLPSADQSAAEFAAVATENLLRQRTEPEAVANAVAYLLSADSVTGQNLFVDGGQRFLPRDGDVMFETRREH